MTPTEREQVMAAIERLELINPMVISIERNEEWTGGEPTLGTCRVLGQIKHETDAISKVLISIIDSDSKPVDDKDREMSTNINEAQDACSICGAHHSSTACPKQTMNDRTCETCGKETSRSDGLCIYFETGECENHSNRVLRQAECRKAFEKWLGISFEKMDDMGKNIYTPDFEIWQAAWKEAKK